MKVIGLCGGSGSGKGTVSTVFSDLGIPSIDTDAVYREMTRSDSPCMQALAKAFGYDIVADGGGLERSKLASIVFGDHEKLSMLNSISHQYILAETRRRLASYKSEGYKAAIVDAPVLFESGFDSECDIVICVISDPDLRVKRIIERDGISQDAALKRLSNQIPNEELVSRCDYVIYNNSGIDELKAQISEIYKIIFENLNER